ncbi:nucleotidyltransferase family protein [Nocardia goodfellowii]|uniref:Uncharacterized protein n=1 Tax=Nocardia goodfellowii TaxID=882446 RepID=A0ABS4QHG6_9NOCA|nr:hypothetical protein [Nocardia goodfellowii]MBP2191132.1 hypothetical protein [Nocardia goodfellowii]
MDARQDFDKDRPTVALAGTWAVRYAKPDDLVHLTIRPTSGAPNSTSAVGVRLSALPGLAPEELLSQHAQARFKLIRDTGAIAFEGHVGAGQGGGEFVFQPSTGFTAAMRSVGYGSFSVADLFRLAIHNIGMAFLRELSALGHQGVPVDDLLEMRIHGVSPALIQELQTLGYRNSITVEQLILMRIHGVTPEFIRALHDLGYDGISVDDLLEMRIHGVSPALIQELQTLGYQNSTTPEQLTIMRIHGVTPQFIRGVRDRGHDGVPVDDLLEMRMHGIGAYR